jgi:HPt (histidine-containing phosphotransfer) domain-containing protein
MKASDPILDSSTIDELRCLGQDVIGEVISVFLDEGPRRLAEIEKAAASGDGEALWKSAHELRSVASNLGAMRVAAVCDLLQDQGGMGALDDIGKVTGELGRELELARQAIEQIVG